MGQGTHQVTNQVPDLLDYNLYLTDRALQEGVRREGAGWHEEALIDYGEQLGLPQSFAAARDANRYKPELEAFDRHGVRVDRVHFHPAWRQFMRMAFAQSMHCSAWRSPCVGAHVARAATYLLHGQIEAGSLCPTTMTSAAIPVLQREPLFESIKTMLYSDRYDERDQPVAGKMGMTEKQGGSDLRSNTTCAEPVAAAGRGATYRLTGHKWFFSSPDSDAHLVLAKHKQVFSCFYVPRWRAEGGKNPVHIQRLKDKMGNSSNASAEVEFSDAQGVLVGEEGRGIGTLVEMAMYTRLDCVLGSAALLRQALVQALHHANHRFVFGHALIGQPLMQSVLADLALESEAATVLALRLARALDDPSDSLNQAYRRVLTPAAKFWICKRGIDAVAECMEVWGGNGYIEEAPMARLYRESPVNSIWEGSGNVMCLDVLRAINRQPELADVLCATLLRDCAGEPLLKECAARLSSVLSTSGPTLEAAGRYVAQELVLLSQASLLLQCAPQAVADAFIQTRFAGRGGRVFGVGIPSALAGPILERAWSESSVNQLQSL
ncbi:MAG: isovaleryl-CoA dehydrogenase [Burkholderiaceae bacterium]